MTSFFYKQAGKRLSLALFVLIVGSFLTHCKIESKQPSEPIAPPPGWMPSQPLPPVAGTALSLASIGDEDGSLNRHAFRGDIKFQLENAASPSVSYDVCTAEEPKTCYKGSAPIYQLPIPGRPQSMQREAIDGVSCFPLRELALTFRLKRQFVINAVKAVNSSTDGSLQSIPERLYLCWTEGTGTYWSWSMVLK